MKAPASIIAWMEIATADGPGVPSSQEPREGNSNSAEPASGPPAVAPDSDLPGTILSIQILRFVAALSVVVFHAHVALLRQISGHSSDQIDHAFGVGASGVHIFFVISGFVMVYTTWRSRLTSTDFLARRLIRIYPIYWVMAATYFLAHLLLSTPYHLSPADIVRSALLIPYASAMIIGPGWTLSFEMYFYLCFALALVAGFRRGLIILSILYPASIAVGLFLGPRSGWEHLVTNSLLLEFVAGAWLGFAFTRGLVVSSRVGGFLVVTGAALLISGCWLDYERIPSVISWGIPSFMLVSGALAFEPHLRSALGRRLAKMGDSSYLLYLSHVLILDLLIATPVRMLCKDEFSTVWLSLPLALVSTVVAALGYEGVELPMLKAMKKWVLPRTRTQRKAQAELA